jgi:hypothetical protein
MFARNVSTRLKPDRAAEFRGTLEVELDFPQDCRFGFGATAAVLCPPAEALQIASRPFRLCRPKNLN